MATPKLYKTCDEQLKKLKVNLKQEIDRLSVLPIDELNVLELKKETKELLKRLITASYISYLIISKDVRFEAIKLLSTVGLESKTNPVGKEWVTKVLKEYNLLTGYLYFSEAERKRMRLVEEILTARDFKSVEAYETAIRYFGNLWWTQVLAYANQMVDKTMLKVYEDAGVKWVKWEAEDDEKTCHICVDLDQKVFKLKDIPGKPHRNCRCWLTPVKEP